MGPVRPGVRRPFRRGRRPRSRVPLHRRVRQDPGAVRYWLVVAALALVLASVVGQALHRAEEARAGWGRTARVWVIEQPLRAGAPIAGAVRSQRWPAALVPANAVAEAPRAGRTTGPLDPGVVLTAAMVDRGAHGGAGRRTIAVPLSEARLPVREGDVVDVWATADPALVAEGTSPTRRVATGAVVADASDGAVVLRVPRDQVAPVADAAATATITLVGTG